MKMKVFCYLCLALLVTTTVARNPPPPPPPGSTSAPDTTTASADGYVFTTDDVETSSTCGDDAIGYYEVYETDEYRYVIVSGAPAHEAEYDQENANPNTRCERWQYVKLPLTWSDSGSTTQQMGATGYVTSGAVLFDARSSPNGDLAIYYEGDTLDPYNGHSDIDKQYHYHAVPNGWSSANDADACEHIGYMHDGAKLYGYCGSLDSCYVQNSSDTPTTEDDYTYTDDDDCELDECNMYNMDGEMVYVMTPSWPYVPPCLKGTVSTAYGY